MDAGRGVVGMEGDEEVPVPERMSGLSLSPSSPVASHGLLLTLLQVDNMKDQQTIPRCKLALKINKIYKFKKQEFLFHTTNSAWESNSFYTLQWMTTSFCCKNKVVFGHKSLKTL